MTTLHRGWCLPRPGPRLDWRVDMGEFIDMQAEIGVSKHQGGLPATRQLLEMCHIEDAREVLDVGCGTGVGPAYIARTHDCHVVGVDLSPRMIEWARRRAREESVEDRVELRTADVLELPFESDTFDVVVSESVLAFVDDKPAAIRELVRVTRPGGYVGLNEAVWLEQDRQSLDRLAKDLGAVILTAGEWRDLWAASGLRDEVVKVRRVDAAVEVRRRMRWIGLSWLIRAWGRAAYLYATKPAIRHSISAVFGGGSTLDHWYYGLMVGRK
jgi:SAM-dependent methyltransferase